MQAGADGVQIVGDKVVGNNVCGFVKPEPGQGGQHAAFAGDAGGQDHVKRRKPVRGDNQQRIAEVVDVAHFALNKLRQAGNVGLEECASHSIIHGMTFPKIWEGLIGPIWRLSSLSTRLSPST